MPGTPSITSLANECSLRYVQEFDYRYSVDRPPIDEAFFKEVVEIVKDTGPLWGFGVERVYNFVKKKILERKEKQTLELTKANKVLNVFGNGSVLLYGDARPFFEILK